MVSSTTRSCASHRAVASLTRWSTQARGDPLATRPGDAGHDLGVWQELPRAVRRGDEEFVIWRKSSHAAVRLGGHADGVRDLVADAPRHGEARHVRVGQPDARRPMIPSSYSSAKTRPPQRSILSFSSGVSGLWSVVSGSARTCAQINQWVGCSAPHRNAKLGLCTGADDAVAQNA